MFRLTFITKDGSLIQDRIINPTWLDLYISDKTFREGVMDDDARKKGVKVISYTLDRKTGIKAIVDWL